MVAHLPLLTWEPVSGIEPLACRRLNTARVPTWSTGRPVQMYFCPCGFHGGTERSFSISEWTVCGPC
jgi:hypothetical protein